MPGQQRHRHCHRSQQRPAVQGPGATEALLRGQDRQRQPDRRLQDGQLLAGVGSEVAAESEGQGGEEGDAGVPKQAPAQQEREDGGQGEVQHRLHFQGHVGVAEGAGQQDQQQPWGVERRRLDVGQEGKARVGALGPQRQLAGKQTLCLVAGEGVELHREVAVRVGAAVERIKGEQTPMEQERQQNQQGQSQPGSPPRCLVHEPVACAAGFRHLAAPSSQVPPNLDVPHVESKAAWRRYESQT